MAIIEGVPGRQAWIEINGTRAAEYTELNALELSSGRISTAKRYIESIDGATFPVHFRIDDSYDWNYRRHWLQVHVKVDGSYQGREFRSTSSTMTREEPCESSRRTKGSR